MFFSSYYKGYKHNQEGGNSRKEICDYNSFKCNIKEQDPKTVLLNFDKGEIETCKNMFKDLENILEIDLPKFDTSGITSMAHMFENCKNLRKVTFGKMDTSNVEDMQYMFHHCNSLSSIDLSNFETSSVTNMGNMFSCLHSLESLKLSEKFNTSKVKNMTSMFYHLKNMISIGLSMFDTKNVQYMSYMFYDAENLRYLNISNYNTQKVNKINYMFGNCFALQYLDINKFNLSNNEEAKEVFKSQNIYLKFCLNDSDTINHLLNSKQDRLICSDTCMNENNIYIDKVRNICVESCNPDFYLFDISCYEKCPESTIVKNSKSHECISKTCNDGEQICKDNAPEGYHFIASHYEECFKNCKKCDGSGDEKNNNCQECKSGYKFLNDSQSTNNNC